MLLPAAGGLLSMRVLLVTSPHPEASWLHKALQESGHSLQRADELRDGLFLASQEAFDAIVVTAFEPGADAALIGMLPRFVADGGGAALVVLLGHASASERIRALRAGADACFGAPYPSSSCMSACRPCSAWPGRARRKARMRPPLRRASRRCRASSRTASCDWR